MNYVIIGGGVAGTTLAEELRKKDSEASIVILEREMHRLYSKVLLMNYVEGKIQREKLFLKKLEWYGDQNIEFESGTEVEKIDTKNKFVAASNGREYPYDKLIIASGMQPRQLPSAVRGLAYFRNLDDAEDLKEQIAKIKAEKEKPKAIVHGGGFISTELIDIFDHFGFEVSVILRSSGFWSKILSAESQKVLEEYAKERGVAFYTNATAEILEENGEITGMQIENGEKLEADIVGVGIGVVGELSILTEAGIECGRGVLVDEFLQTSQEDVYAIGDIAEYNDIVAGRQVVSGNWLGAIMHARTLAANLTGEKRAFELTSAYTTRLFDKEIVFIGDVSRQAADNVRLLENDRENSIELFERDGRTVGALLIGDVSKRQEITNAIQNKKLYS